MNAQTIERMSPKSVLAQMRVAEPDDVYLIGGKERHITLYAQQRRGFNLIWALFREGAIATGDTLAVVGGGVAGVTAASAAAVKGCKVMLFERSGQLLHLQAGNTTRYVHPTVFYWPKEHRVSYRTELPFLNWNAGYAGDVASQILSQFNALRLEHKIEVRVHREIVEITRHKKRFRLTTREGDVITRSFRCVILAVGFGIEQPLRGFPSRSYWDDDSLHQPLKNSVSPRTYLVSGCGDSGLTDVLRLKIDRFQHHILVSDLLLRKEYADVRSRLSEIEIEAQRRTEEEPTADQSAFIYKEYSQLSIPDTQSANLTWRTDTRVTLNGRNKYPFALNSSILNRFLVFLLYRAKQVQYIQGDMTENSIARTDRGSFVVRVGKRSDAWREYDDVLVRQGPKSSLGATFPRIDARLPDPSPGAPPSAIAEEQWEPGFFPEVKPGLRPSVLYAKIELQSGADLDLVRKRVLGVSGLMIGHEDPLNSTLYMRPIISNDEAVRRMEQVAREIEHEFGARTKIEIRQETDFEVTSGEDDHLAVDQILAIIRAPESWLYARGAGVDIAVVATGVDGAILELQPQRRTGGWAPPGEDPWTDWDGYGSGIACVAAGTRASGGGIDGVAPDAGVISCRSRLFDTELAVIYDYLIDLAERGRRIVAVNGFGFPPGSPYPKNSPFQEALDDAIKKNILVVFSAGNYHRSTEGGPYSCKPNSIGAYKSRADVLTVGSCNGHGRVHPFSSRGPGEWFGQANTSLKPDVIAPAPSKTTRPRIYSGSGSSAAIVAGMAALVWSARPDLTAQAVMEVIRVTARPQKNGATCEGHGLIDCLSAVKLAREMWYL